jgi:hypothetical protein
MIKMATAATTNGAPKSDRSLREPALQILARGVAHRLTLKRPTRL